jgi:hypothetical protein
METTTKKVKAVKAETAKVERTKFGHYPWSRSGKMDRKIEEGENREPIVKMLMATYHYKKVKAGAVLTSHIKFLKEKKHIKVTETETGHISVA